MTILLGLCAAALYGSADFCGGLAAKRSPIWGVVVMSQAAGLVLLVALLPFVPGRATATDYGWGAIAGICGGLGLALLYHALSIGKMGVVSPITAVLAAAVPTAVSTLSGGRLSAFQIAGMLAAFAAIVLISSSHEETGLIEWRTAGLKEAVASGLLLGGFYLFLARSGAHAALYPLVSARLASVAALASIAFLTRNSLRPAPGAWSLILAAGAIDVTANAFYVLATFNGNLAIAAVLTSLYPASTVALAWIFLKERLGRAQYAGLACALAGVALIAS